VCQQLECEGAGDVVGDVGHAQVKVGQVNLHEVPVNDLQLLLVGCALHTARQLQHLGGAACGMCVCVCGGIQG
jgi:hypothetical protein